MTRKDFELIAATLKNTKPHNANEEGMRQWHYMVGQFTTMCASQNPNFNRDCFLKACGAV